jgi:hypothetical protein
MADRAKTANRKTPVQQGFRVHNLCQIAGLMFPVFVLFRRLTVTFRDTELVVKSAPAAVNVACQVQRLRTKKGVRRFPAHPSSRTRLSSATRQFGVLGTVTTCSCGGLPGRNSRSFDAPSRAMTILGSVALAPGLTAPSHSVRPFCRRSG